MGPIQELIQWWNLIFILPFVTALGYLLLQAFGGIHFDHGADVHAHFDHDVGVGHGGAGSHDHDVHSGESDSFMLQFLSVLGVGRIPLASVIMSMCFLWGFFGWASNLVLKAILPYPLFVPISAVIALVCSAVLTRYVAIVMGKLMPTTETYGSSHFQLTGSVATARYNLEPQSLGSATLYDEHKNFLEVPCRLMEGEQPIQAGESIILMLYNDDEGYFEVSRNPLLSGKDEEKLTNGK